jgi:hypothetical protein
MVAPQPVSIPRTALSRNGKPMVRRLPLVLVVLARQRRGSAAPLWPHGEDVTGRAGQSGKAGLCRSACREISGCREFCCCVGYRCALVGRASRSRTRAIAVDARETGGYRRSSGVQRTFRPDRLRGDPAPRPASSFSWAVASRRARRKRLQLAQNTAASSVSTSIARISLAKIGRASTHWGSRG